MDQFLTPLIYVLAFVAVVLLVQAISGFLFSARDRTRQLNRRLTMLESGMSQDDMMSNLLRKAKPPPFGGPEFARFYEGVATYLQQAGMRISPLRLAGIWAVVAVAFWLAGLVFVGMRGGNLLKDGLGSLVGAVVLSALGVGYWVRRERLARLKKIEEQLPLALDIVTRAIRAGHPVISAMDLASNELGDPIGSEFGLIVDETTYGSEFNGALANFARRTGSEDAHYFAVAVSIQSETGGNLAEILEGLVKVMRGRGTLAKRVKALASEGMASAYLLSALPPLLIGFIFLINPKMYTEKFDDPIFWPTASVVFTLYIVGWLVIRRIINFKF
jgi:tight adherence protein B